MESNNNEIKAKAGNSNMYLVISIILLIVVSSISGILWTMQKTLQRDIQISNDKIANFDKQILELKKDNEIAAYDIVISSEKSISKDIEESKAQNYITEVISLGKKYKLMFSGFSYDGNSINTVATTNNKDSVADSVFIVSNFIKDFRTIGNPIFTLEPVSSVTGDILKRTFDVTLKIIKK
ncbi:MAG: hypothetical protein PHZ26_00985 [Candidatus Gracilibacteria bacterium]|nr:hypothetical protein [Candidatus Gracilibacteria bacterium]MDD2908309.1 hypothetical protein [Candidatus Gracilibacteria bacterium]